MTPEQRYPEVAQLLSIWAQHARGGNNLPGTNDDGWQRINLLARIKRMRENAGLCERTSRQEAPVLPLVVDEMERALIGLPDIRWQKALTYQWVRHWQQREIAKRMGVTRMTLWTWRVHAYGSLAERLNRDFPLDQTQYLVGSVSV